MFVDKFSIAECCDPCLDFFVGNGGIFAKKGEKRGGCIYLGELTGKYHLQAAHL